MVFDALSWPYKAEATSAKLQQMVDNLVAHDHRPDASQGAPMWSDWQNAATVAASAGWALVGTPRYRLLLGGVAVEYDVIVQRTGGDLVASSAAGSRPGNMADTFLFGGMPVGVYPTLGQRFLASANGCMLCLVNSGDGVLVECGVTSGSIETGNQVVIRPVLMR